MVEFDFSQGDAILWMVSGHKFYLLTNYQEVNAIPSKQSLHLIMIRL